MCARFLSVAAVAITGGHPGPPLPPRLNRPPRCLVEVAVRCVERLIIISGPFGRDAEARRWYSDRAETCFVLSKRGRLLEPYPTIGPTSYRLIACRTSLAEANAYAVAHDCVHQRLSASD
jgi:hypothetical protein